MLPKEVLSLPASPRLSIWAYVYVSIRLLHIFRTILVTDLSWNQIYTKYASQDILA